MFSSVCPRSKEKLDRDKTITATALVSRFWQWRNRGAAAGGGQGLGHRQTGQGFELEAASARLEPLSPQHISQPEIEMLGFRSERDNDAKEPFKVVPGGWYCSNMGSVPAGVVSTSISMPF